MPTTDDFEQVLFRIAPYQYLHVLDTNTSVTRNINGPCTFTRQDHEKVVQGPTAMITIPPRHYVIIADPAIHDEEGKVCLDEHGLVRLKHGDFEVRLSSAPFPLYPGESQHGPISQLLVVEKNQAIKLKASREFTEEDGSTRMAGDEWLLHGPITYFPRIEVAVEELLEAAIIEHSQALRIRAKAQMCDSKGVQRCAGEEWLVRDTGAYMPSIDEDVVETVKAIVLTEKRALHLVALNTFTDVYGTQRRAGEQWLVTNEMADSHLCDVYEQVMGEVPLTTLSSRQYTVIVDPFVDGVQKFGVLQLRKGEASFFLKPGEQLRNGIQSIEVLGDDEALLLQAAEAFDDFEPSQMSASDDGVVVTTSRVPGDCWMVYGPRDYIPPVEVEILEKRRKIPLDENEGLYVRNVNTGIVTAVVGETYLLDPHEELWEKELPTEVEELLAKQAEGQTYQPSSAPKKESSELTLRDKTKVVTYRVPHNAACQVYDFKTKSSRVVFGPDLVMLSPDEQFTVLSLSGDKPKRPGMIKSLNLMLGPDFMTDIIVVETSDHARLKLQVAYNWHFLVPEDPELKSSIFNVRDFTGDACKAIASRVRSAVASESFDNFHKNSARIIRKSVFGEGDDGKIRRFFEFSANNLVVTNIDIQSVEPVDESTRNSLQQSVQLAIQITTQSQEARARHDAHREEEEAKGMLERQRLVNEAQAEQEKKTLLQLKAECNAVETSGQATAEARARAEAAQIEGEARVKQAELKAAATKIEMEARLECMRMEQEAEAAHRQRMDALEVERAKQLSEIETSKFQDTVSAIGSNTLVEMAKAGPEAQAKLLGGLGLQGYLVTDGKNPINLLSTAQGFLGGGHNISE